MLPSKLPSLKDKINFIADKIGLVGAPDPAFIPEKVAETNQEPENNEQ